MDWQRHSDLPGGGPQQRQLVDSSSRLVPELGLEEYFEPVAPVWNCRRQFGQTPFLCLSPGGAEAGLLSEGETAPSDLDFGRRMERSGELVRLCKDVEQYPSSQRVLDGESGISSRTLGCF